MSGLTPALALTGAIALAGGVHVQAQEPTAIVEQVQDESYSSCVEFYEGRDTKMSEEAIDFRCKPLRDSEAKPRLTLEEEVDEELVLPHHGTGGLFVGVESVDLSVTNAITSNETVIPGTSNTNTTGNEQRLTIGGFWAERDFGAYIVGSDITLSSGLFDPNSDPEGLDLDVAFAEGLSVGGYTVFNFSDEKPSWLMSGEWRFDIGANDDDLYMLSLRNSSGGSLGLGRTLVGDPVRPYEGGTFLGIVAQGAMFEDYSSFEKTINEQGDVTDYFLTTSFDVVPGVKALFSKGFGSEKPWVLSAEALVEFPYSDVKFEVLDQEENVLVDGSLSRNPRYELDLELMGHIGKFPVAFTAGYSNSTLDSSFEGLQTNEEKIEFGVKFYPIFEHFN